MNDAYAAGVKECYSATCQNNCTKPEVLYNEFIRDGDWPKLTVFDVPLVSRVGEQVPSSPRQF
eukprot:338573-Amphidinium_carterae.1